jgi:hypothetical protein
MTLSAWRPLKDAPTTGIVTVKTPIYGLVIAYYEPQDEYWFHWYGGLAHELTGNELCTTIADTLELDRAVQSEIARAFGELLGGLLAASQQEHLASFAPPKQTWVKKRLLREANESRQRGLRAFSAILHTAMGGRIPDEVP